MDVLGFVSYKVREDLCTVLELRKVQCEASAETCGGGNTDP